MHHDEYWQLFSPNGEPLPGGSHLSSQPVPSDQIYGIVLVFFYRFVDGELELLFQKRSAHVDRSPGLWDISAGGHVNYNEPLLDAAVRESREEIGATISRNRLEYGFSELNSVSLTTTYFYNWTGRADDFSFADGEVSEVKWVKLSASDDFRHQFCKPRVADDDFYFSILRQWFSIHGYLDK